MPSGDSFIPALPASRPAAMPPAAAPLPAASPPAAMPYEWRDDGTAAVLTLWPHRSLPARGFVWVIAIAAGGLAMPLLALVGSPVMWGLLPFGVLAVWALWAAIARTNRAAALTETLALAPASLHLTRRDPGRPDRVWTTNPYWVRVSLRDGPVEDYLTLAVEGRELELGAFLSPAERRALHDDLARRLAALRLAAP